MLKNVSISTLLVLTALPVFGQNVFYNFPQNKQFYQRDSLGFSAINIFGTATNQDYKAIKLTIKQNGENYFSETISLLESNEYSWSTSLVSGLFEYDFEIKLFLENDSTTLAKASGILSGDTYLIYGQSNAVAGCCFDVVRREMDDTYLRNFVYDHFNPSSSNNGWHDLGVEFNWPGVLGSRLAENIIERNHVPVQIINGAVGGEPLHALADRDSLDVQNDKTYYGRFLRRILGSGSVKPKGFIFSQGEWESETGVPEAISSYRERFNKLVSGLREDGVWPDFLYLIQTNILSTSSREGAGSELRDVQRRLKEDLPELRLYAAFGKEISGDGLHYAKPGFESIADDIYLGINKDVYGLSFDAPVTGPLIQKAVLNKEGKKVSLVFDEGQRLSVENIKDYGHYQRWFKDYVYDASGQTFIDSARASLNEVDLYFSSDFDGKSISYLPSAFTDNFSKNYNGPIIANNYKLPALSFSNFETCEVLAMPRVLSQKLVANGVSLRLEKGTACNSCTYELFGRSQDSHRFEYLGSEAYSSDSVYVDLSWSGNVRNVFIQVKVVSDVCQSDYVKLNLDKCPLEGIKENLPFVSNKLSKDKGSTPIVIGENELVFKPSGFSNSSQVSQAQEAGALINKIGRCVNN